MTSPPPRSACALGLRGPSVERLVCVLQARSSSSVRHLFPHKKKKKKKKKKHKKKNKKNKKSNRKKDKINTQKNENQTTKQENEN